MKLNGKRVDLVQLRQELAAAGITLGALGTAGDDLTTYDADGKPQEMPAGAGAVVDAHVPPPATDYGASADVISDRQKIAAYVTQSKGYLGIPNASKTIADVVQQTNRNTNAILSLIKLLQG